MTFDVQQRARQTVCEYLFVRIDEIAKATGERSRRRQRPAKDRMIAKSIRRRISPAVAISVKKVISGTSVVFPSKYQGENLFVAGVIHLNGYKIPIEMLGVPALRLSDDLNQYIDERPRQPSTSAHKMSTMKNGKAGCAYRGAPICGLNRGSPRRAGQAHGKRFEVRWHAAPPRSPT